jgi:nitroreductase
MSITGDNFYLRKSCRKYLDKSVPRELVDKIIDAGRHAPSVCNICIHIFMYVFREEINNLGNSMLF